MIKTGDVFRRPILEGREAYISEQLVLGVGAGMTVHGVYQGVFQGVTVAAANTRGN